MPKSAWIGLSDVGDEEGGKSDIELEREDGFEAMSHVEGGVAGGFASRRAVCLECVRGYSWPLYLRMP